MKSTYAKRSDEQKQLFNSRLLMFLNGPSFPDMSLSTSVSISNAVTAMYDSKMVYYHSHNHINNILDIVDELDIPLLTWEKIVVFFHDVIYNPLKSDNESLSSMFMQSLLTKFVDSDTLELAVFGINQTANHLDNECDVTFHTIMDLDLANIGSPSKNYISAGEDIRNEFSHLQLVDYLNGRKKFLGLLLNRSDIFRTSTFKGYESQARQNIECDLKSIEHKLEVISL